MQEEMNCAGDAFTRPRFKFTYPPSHATPRLRGTGSRCPATGSVQILLSSNCLGFVDLLPLLLSPQAFNLKSCAMYSVTPTRSQPACGNRPCLSRSRWRSRNLKQLVHQLEGLILADSALVAVMAFHDSAAPVSRSSPPRQSRPLRGRSRVRNAAPPPRQYRVPTCALHCH